jgi:hypothetical protein
MKTGAKALLILLFLVLVLLFYGAQCAISTSPCSRGVPHHVV